MMVGLIQKTEFKNKLKKLKYKIYKDDKKLIKKGIKILKSDKLLRKNLNNFLKKDHNKDLELAAEDLRLATRHLGSIVGKVDVEEILGSIFNDFCIGK